MSPEYLGVRAVLQAGGKGLRLSPGAKDLPKPLVKVGGIPMVERLLWQLIHAGVRKVTVVTGQMGEQIEAHLLGLTDLPDDLELDFFQESQPMGNVGALAHLRDASEPVLLVFADLVTNLDFAELVAIHTQRRSQVTLTSHYETHQLQLGELLTDNDQVTKYQEKPVKESLICSGIAVFEPQVLNLIDSNHPCGISDLVSAAITRDMMVTHWKHGAFWLDVNTPEALERAEREIGSQNTGIG